MPRAKHKSPRYRLARRNDGGWEVRWTADGRSKRVSCGTTDPDTANRFLAGFIASRGSAPPSPTVGPIIEAYWESHGRQTLASYNLKLRLDRLKDHFGYLPAAHVNPAVVRAYHAKRARVGVSPGTIALECRTLATALSWAVKNGWLVHAPHVARPRSGAPRERFLSRAEADALVRAARSPHVRLFILLGLHTGARKGAILGLTWDRVDLVARRIDFNEPERPVTQKRRAVAPINDTLMAALLEARELAQTGWVIEYAGARVGCIDAAFKATAKRAGLTGVHPHVLRHTAASRMAQAGVPLWHAAQILGMSVGMLERIYAHWEPDYGREAVKALEG